MGDYIPDPDNPGKQIPKGVTYSQKQKDAMAWPLENATGSLTFRDDNSLKDSGGDKRLDFTDEGALTLRDEDGNAGITLNTDLSTTFAGNVTGSLVSTGSFGSLELGNLPKVEPLTTGSLWISGSGSGAASGSGYLMVAGIHN